MLSKIVIASVEYRVRIEKVLGRSEGKFLAGGMKLLVVSLMTVAVSFGTSASDNFSNWTSLERRVLYEDR